MSRDTAGNLYTTGKSLVASRARQVLRQGRPGGGVHGGGACALLPGLAALRALPRRAFHGWLGAACCVRALVGAGCSEQFLYQGRIMFAPKNVLLVWVVDWLLQLSGFMSWGALMLSWGGQVPLSALKWQQRHLASSCPDVTLLDHSSDPELQARLGTAHVQHYTAA